MSAASLVGRSAIITGASLGLGRAIAECFFEAGAGLLLVARGAEALEQTRAALASRARPGQVLLTTAADVGDPAACARVARLAEERLPDLAILVNNAGIYGPMGALESVDWTAWIEALRINLFGTAQMCRELIPGLRARGYGKIINLSGGGATAPLPFLSAYAASKAAVVRLTETLALELQDAHVDVNAIAPGALNTRLLDEVLAAGPEKVGADFHARALKQQAEGGAPLDKGARLALFLASAASDGLTGRLLSALWDDWASLPSRRDELARSDVYTLRRIVPEDRGWS